MEEIFFSELSMPKRLQGGVAGKVARAHRLRKLLEAPAIIEV